jgi:hypothetical protein
VLVLRLKDQFFKLPEQMAQAQLRIKAVDQAEAEQARSELVELVPLVELGQIKAAELALSEAMVLAEAVALVALKHLSELEETVGLVEAVAVVTSES